MLLRAVRGCAVPRSGEESFELGRCARLGVALPFGADGDGLVVALEPRYERGLVGAGEALLI